MPTALALEGSDATATNTQLPTVTNTPAPTATEAPEATAIKNQVNSDADRCIGILFGRLLVPVNNFFPASLLLYNDDECSQSGGYEFSAPGDYGTAYSTTGPEAAAAICQAENADGFDYTVSPFAMHEDLYVCIRGEASATETQSTQPQQQAAEPTATPTNTPVPTATNTPVSTATNTPVPTATNTPVPTATNTPVPTATNTPAPTATNTPAPTPSGFCVLVGPGTYWLFPDNRFLSGLITVYSGSDCEELDSTQASIGEDGYVYTTAGQATAMDLCASGHGDGSTYNVVPCLPTQMSGNAHCHRRTRPCQRKPIRRCLPPPIRRCLPPPIRRCLLPPIHRYRRPIHQYRRRIHRYKWQIAERLQTCS